MSARGGRGRGRGGGFSAPRGGGQAPSLAAQVRQVNRLAEPDEMATFRRFRDMGCVHVRSTYGSTGLLDREVGFPAPLLRGNSETWSQGVAVGDAPVVYVPLIGAESLRSAWEAWTAKERAISRIPVRLPDKATATWEDLSQEERRLCLLSNAEYQRFLARGANPRGGDQSVTRLPSSGEVRVPEESGTNAGPSGASNGAPSGVPAPKEKGAKVSKKET